MSQPEIFCDDHAWVGRGECPRCYETCRHLTPEPETPQIGSSWRHHNGAEYEVLMIANAESTRPEYPPSVVYRGLANGKVWSRPVSDWHRSMTARGVGRAMPRQTGVMSSRCDVTLRTVHHPLQNIAEWRKGCSCAPVNPHECADCTNALVSAIEEWFSLQLHQSPHA